MAVRRSAARWSLADELEEATPGADPNVDGRDRRHPWVADVEQSVGIRLIPEVEDLIAELGTARPTA